MDAEVDAVSVGSTARKRFSQLCRFGASLPLAFALMIILASLICCATILETRHGRAYACWYVYGSWWFAALLALLAVNIFCAAAIRYPWRRHQSGLLLTHAGLLVLLAGSFQSFFGSVDGLITLSEGDSTSHLQLNEYDQITAAWVDRPAEPTYEFSFQAGPVDWTKGRVLDVGEVDGVRANICGYLAHAIAQEQLVADRSDKGGPALRFQVVGQEGSNVTEQWLADERYGDAVLVGPIRIQLQRATGPAMLDEFRKPLPEKMGEKGVIVMSLQNIVERVSVDENIGKTIALNDQVSVEILEYLPHAKPDKLGNFASKDEQPKNPLVELRITIAGEAQKYRQIAFAKDPLLNLDGVGGSKCPVTFRYYHPAIRLPAGIELLQGSDKKIYARTCSSNDWEFHGELQPNEVVRLPAGFDMVINEYLPHATREVTFVAAEPSPGSTAKEQPQPAALVEMTIGQVKQQVWLQRNDFTRGPALITAAQGTLGVHYEVGKLPLGFTLKLLEIQSKSNSSDADNASFTSKVRAIDRGTRLEHDASVSINKPLTYGKYTFYPLSVDEAGHGRATCTWKVAHDPGRFAKYAGSCLICFGISVMFFMRVHSVRESRSGRQKPPAAVTGEQFSSSVTMQKPASDRAAA